MIEIKEIVTFLAQGNDNSEQIVFDSWVVENQHQAEIINYLYEKDCVKDFYGDASINDTITFSIDWENLLSLKIYRTKEEFIRANQRGISSNFYIDENNCYHDSQSDFLELYKNVIQLRNSLTNLARHSFIESGEDCIVLSNNQQSIVMRLSYEISKGLEQKRKLIGSFASVLEIQSEKQKLYIAELVQFYLNRYQSSLNELLNEIEEIYDRCENSYEFYLSNFSSNKLRLEIDSKMLDYTTRLQGVINDSQSKLIAIPTAFVLAAASISFKSDDMILGSKNIAVLISLLLFAGLIQIFLSNQFSTLDLIKESLKEFKSSYSACKIDFVNESFLRVEKIWKEQHRRIFITNILLWVVPVVLIFWIGIKACLYYL